MKNLILLITTLWISAAAFAANNTALSLPGYFGNINNNTSYVLECSQVIGGYCANNPMPANGYIQMLPDPGSKEIRGHIMAFDKKIPGRYVDNIIFTYKEQKNGQWAFHMRSLDKNISIKWLTADTILLTDANTK